MFISQSNWLDQTNQRADPSPCTIVIRPTAGSSGVARYSVRNREPIRNVASGLPETSGSPIGTSRVTSPSSSRAASNRPCRTSSRASSPW